MKAVTGQQHVLFPYRFSGKETINIMKPIKSYGKGKRLFSLAAVFLVLVLTSTTAVAMAPYGGKKNYMSFALGGYAPGEDLDDEGYKTGADFSFSYMSVVKDYFGFGGSLHTYGTESKKSATDIGDGDFVSMGIEGLFYVQPNAWRVQPYLALGPALYFNGLEYDRDEDDENIDESGVGFGFVMELGVRAFITQRLFGGFSFKGFSNRWEVEYRENKDKTYDFGGGVFAFLLGFTF